MVWGEMERERVDCLLQEPLVVVVNSHLVEGLLSHSQLPVKRGHRHIWLRIGEVQRHDELKYPNKGDTVG